MSVDICYVVSHGFASRMLTQTNLLGRLRNSGLSVAVICPDKNDPALAAYCAEHGVWLEEYEPRKTLFSEDYLFKRRYYLEDIRSNPALWEKHLSATRFHPARNPFKRLRPHYYYLMYKLIPRFQWIRERFIATESKYLNSPEAEALLDRLKPRKLVATYPISLGEAILLHYGNRREDTETWIHLLSWDNITCKGRFVETADRYIAWGPVMRDELKTYYGMADERIAVCGVPHFDLHVDPRAASARPEVLRALGLDPDKPYLMFAMSSPRFAPNEIDVVEWLATQVIGGVFGEMQLLVRPHPQNVTGNMADATWLPRLHNLARTSGIGVAFPKLVSSKLRWSMAEEDMLELAATLSGAMVVLNSGSTVSIDALMHGKPVVVTSFDGGCVRNYWDSAQRLMDYPHLKTLDSLGGLLIAKSYDELLTHIKSECLDPGRLAKARKTALLQECHLDDGESTNRVVAALRQDTGASSSAAKVR